MIRSRAGAWIDTIIEDELESVLQAKPATRIAGSAGLPARLPSPNATTSLGCTTIAMRGARMPYADGSTTEWQPSRPSVSAVHGARE